MLPPCDAGAQLPLLKAAASHSTEMAFAPRRPFSGQRQQILQMLEARGNPVPSRLLACRTIAPAGYREGRKLRQRAIANFGNPRVEVALDRAPPFRIMKSA